MKFKKITLIIIAIFLMGLIILLFLFFNKFSQSSSTIHFPNKNIIINAKIAKTQSELEKGLMNVEYLPKNKGMLFILPKEGHDSFWMKNTLISLDIIFLDKDKKIVDIFQNVPICKNDPCETYTPKTLSQYVLEVNSGFVNENNISIGDSIEF